MITGIVFMITYKCIDGTEGVIMKREWGYNQPNFCGMLYEWDNCFAIPGVYFMKRAKFASLPSVRVCFVKQLQGIFKHKRLDFYTLLYNTGVSRKQITALV